jgi:hypothetical protein
MIQPENEYGSFYACDMKYRLWLRDEVRRYFGNDTLQFTSRQIFLLPTLFKSLYRLLVGSFESD